MTETAHARRGEREEPDWSEFRTRLAQFVRRHVGPAEVEEVTGDVLLRLVRHQDALTGARNPVAYMHGVARNAITDLYRRRAAERRATEGAALLELASDAPVNVEMAPSEALATCLVPLIRGLPERYAEALMLTEIEGMSRDAAAARLGLSQSGIKSRVQRGRRLLKHALLRCCKVETNARGDILDYRPVDARQCGCSQS
ncbi:MAG: sigma-70 family RNA polymerase sigma factor [Alphaproteobacteria bacterium]|nr:sigma-70 family RNA polymerase sigma factor [Alphaproteobacteria bacterium]